MPWLFGRHSRKKDAAVRSSNTSRESMKLKRAGWVRDPKNVGWGHRAAHHDMRPRLGSISERIYRRRKR